MEPLVRRRTFIITVTATGSGICRSANARELDFDSGSDSIQRSEWWPYRADTPMRIGPIGPVDSLRASGATIQSKAAPTYIKKLPQASIPTSAHAKRPHDQSAVTAVRSIYLPPKAYDWIGKRFDIDPWLIYGVALQESMLKFGSHTLPYPWTLCVAGVGKRFGSYEATLQALRNYVQTQGIRNVDCGAMQVNWGWHSDKLVSFERALDPYPNLAVGAQILRTHFERKGSWSRAVALYHTGSDRDADTVARGKRYSNGVFARLGSMGLDTQQLHASRGWRRYVA